MHLNNPKITHAEKFGNFSLSAKIQEIVKFCILVILTLMMIALRTFKTYREGKQSSQHYKKLRL